MYCVMISRPLDVIRPCNTFLCQAKWWVSIWSQCICTEMGNFKFRSVHCMRAKDEDATRAEVIDEAECADHVKPSMSKPCNETDSLDSCIRSINPNYYTGSNLSFNTVRQIREISSIIYPMETEVSNITHKPNTMNTTNSPSYKKVQLNDKSSKAKSNIVDGKHSPVNVILSDTHNAIKDKPDKLHGHFNLNILTDKNQNITAKSKLQKPSATEMKLQTDIRGNDIDSKSNLSEAKTKHLKEKLDKGDAENEEESKGTVSESNNEKGVTGEKKVKPLTSVPKDLCETPAPAGCKTFPPATSPKTTPCIHTNAPQPHDKTTCCPRLPFTYPSKENTNEEETNEPIKIKVDQISLTKPGLTLVPVDNEKRKLPQTDEEFKHFGENGLFNVGSPENGTAVIGQDAIDLANKAKENATKLPVIHHEEAKK